MNKDPETKKPKQQPEETAQSTETPETEAATTETSQESQENQEAKQEKHSGKADRHGKHQETAVLEAKLDDAEKQLSELKTQLLRTAAEYENYRKRSLREADQKFNDGISHAVNHILAILDTLDMAANAACTDENYKKGVVMTLDKASQALEKLHVSEIEAQGKPFDPNLMSAVQQVPAPNGEESGTVVQVFQKGYKIGDKIIRHATVVVAE